MIFKKITMAVIAVCAFAGCAKEVEITSPREIKAEFPSSRKEGEAKTLLFLDGIDEPLTASYITQTVKAHKPDLLFLATNGIVEGVPVAKWIEDNRSSWGHDKSASAGGNAMTSSLKSLSTKELQIFISGQTTAPFLKVTAGKYNFICGNVSNKNSIYKNGQNTLIEQTVVADGLARWIVVCHAWWEGATPWDVSQYYWPGYGYNEAIFSKYGKDSYPSRRSFAFVSEGVLNCIGGVQPDPVRFTFNYEEE